MLETLPARSTDRLDRSPSLCSATVPTFTTSASPASTDALAELRRLFASECSLGTSAPGFGVSPPVRSGAANGLVHDSLWRAEAPRTCKASLRVLQERAGPRPFTSCAGDYRLLMASPDQGVSLLAGAVEGEEEDDDCGFGAFGFGPMLDDSRPPSSAASAPPPPRTFSLASSRASPVGSQAWYSGAPAHSPSPDPDSGLLFSY